MREQIRNDIDMHHLSNMCRSHWSILYQKQCERS
jgi:hypothetical protein